MKLGDGKFERGREKEKVMAARDQDVEELGQAGHTQTQEKLRSQRNLSKHGFILHHT
jgi:hypothetical protein